MKNRKNLPLKGRDCLNPNLKGVSNLLQKMELKDPGLKAGVSPNLMKLLRLSICLVVIWLTLFFYIDENNELTELRRLIPQLEKEVKAFEEDNVRLTYEIEQFENPFHLMELVRKPEYSHLKYPYVESVIILQDP
ncbi:MAG TPA: hypothetical protein VIH61_03465 [Waddliaceae bacterium]